MASTFTSKEGSLIHFSIGDVTAPTDVNHAFPPPASLPVHPFPVQCKPDSRSCLSPLLPAASHWGDTTTTAARPGGNCCPVLSGGAAHSPAAGRRWGNTAHSWWEVEWSGSLRVTATTIHLHPLSPSIFCKPGHSSAACCLKKNSFPPALALSHPLPCRPLFSWFPQAKFVSVTGAFPLSVFIYFPPFPTREVLQAQAHESSPSSLIVSLKHILLFQANVIWCFREFVFKDKKCQRTLRLFSFAQSWAELATWLSHSRNLQQTSGCCKVGQREHLGGFYP